MTRGASSGSGLASRSLDAAVDIADLCLALHLHGLMPPSDGQAVPDLATLVNALSRGICARGSPRGTAIEDVGKAAAWSEGYAARRFDESGPEFARSENPYVQRPAETALDTATAAPEVTTTELSESAFGSVFGLRPDSTLE